MNKNSPIQLKRRNNVFMLHSCGDSRKTLVQKFTQAVETSSSLHLENYYYRNLMFQRIFALVAKHSRERHFRSAKRHRARLSPGHCRPEHKAMRTPSRTSARSRRQRPKSVVGRSARRSRCVSRRRCSLAKHFPCSASLTGYPPLITTRLVKIIAQHLLHAFSAFDSCRNLFDAAAR
jgi:hypothetical protein